MVDCQQQYPVGLPAFLSMRYRLPQNLVASCPRPMILSPTSSQASQPSSVSRAPYFTRGHCMQLVLSLEQLRQGLLMSAKNSSPRGLTSNSQQSAGQLPSVAMKNSTASSVYSAELQPFRLEMTSSSVFVKFRNRVLLSWQACTVVGDTPPTEPFWSCTNQWMIPTSVWLENATGRPSPAWHRGIWNVVVWQAHRAAAIRSSRSEDRFPCFSIVIITLWTPRSSENGGGRKYQRGQQRKLRQPERKLRRHSHHSHQQSPAKLLRSRSHNRAFSNGTLRPKNKKRLVLTACWPASLSELWAAYQRRLCRSISCSGVWYCPP